MKFLRFSIQVVWQKKVFIIKQICLKISGNLMFFYGIAELDQIVKCHLLQIPKNFKDVYELLDLILMVIKLKMFSKRVLKHFKSHETNKKTKLLFFFYF